MWKVKKEVISLLGIHQDSLVQHLGELVREDAFRGSSLEGLFLKLALEGGGGIAKDVLLKLTLKEEHLGQASPKHLMTLSHELADCGRQRDGAGVAALAARAFAAKGMVRESQNAYLRGFAMDHTNTGLAAGAARAIASGLEKAKSQAPRLEIGASLVWDLSKYDFTNFTKSQSQLSETFQLPNGINARLALCPKGHSKSSEGMAPLFLCLQKPVILKWILQRGSGEGFIAEADLSKKLWHDGTPMVWGLRNFMPISEAKNGSITFRVLGIQLPGSSLRNELQQDVYSKLEEVQERLQFQDDLKARALRALLEAPRLQIDTSFVWDLSKYDFTKFDKGNGQLSDTVMLPNWIHAWLFLYPKGHRDSSDGMAGLYLHVDRPVVLKWSWQSSRGKVITMQHEFSSTLDEDGHVLRWGDTNFMPIAETDGSVRFRILGIQSAGFKLETSSGSTCFQGLRWFW